MAFDYLIGKYESGDYSVELHEWTDTDVQPAYKDFRVKSETTMIGRRDQPFAIHLRGEIQLQLFDPENYFRDKFKNNTPGKYYLKIIDGQKVHYGFPAANFISSKFWKALEVRTFVFGDGIKVLEVEANNYSGHTQLGDLFYNLLGDIPTPALPLNIVMNYTPVGVMGQGDILPQQIQVLPEDFLRKHEEPSKYDLLMELLRFFRFQIWQENGEWWIVQRSIRDSNPTLYKRNIGGWSSDTLNSTINISRSDLRSEDSEDDELEPVSDYTRTIEQQSYEFETLDPEFDISNWTAGEPDFWPGTGNISHNTIGGGLQFDDKLPVRKQFISRVIRGGDTLNFKFNAEYTLADNLPQGTYIYGLAKIHAIDLGNQNQDYWLNNQGNWGTTEGTISDNLTVDEFSYQKERTLEIDQPVQMPSGFRGVIEITLELTGDDVFDIPPIVYHQVNLTPLEISPAEDTFIVSARLDEPSIINSEEDDFTTTDLFMFSFSPTIKYFNGTEWVRVEDWDSQIPNQQSIHFAVLREYLQQRSTYLRLYTLQINHHLSPRLVDLITLTDFEAGVNFIPFFIKRDRRPGKLLLQIAEKVTTDQITVTWERPLG